jgi:hypothetical protein
MPSHPDHDGKRTTLAAGALLLLPALCCGLPLLIAGGALAGIGGVVGNPWVIGAAVALVVGVVAWRIRRRTATSNSRRNDDCCAPEAPLSGQSRPDTSPRCHDSEP